MLTLVLYHRCFSIKWFESFRSISISLPLSLTHSVCVCVQNRVMHTAHSFYLNCTGIIYQDNIAYSCCVVVAVVVLFDYVCTIRAPVVLHLHGWDAALISLCLAFVSPRMLHSDSFYSSSSIGIPIPIYCLTLIETKHLKKTSGYAPFIPFV